MSSASEAKSKWNGCVTVLRKYSSGAGPSTPIIRNFISRAPSAPGTSSRRARVSKVARSGTAVAPCSIGRAIGAAAGVRSSLCILMQTAAGPPAFRPAVEIRA